MGPSGNGRAADDVMSALTYTSITKAFGDVKAVNDVTLQVPEGQMLGIIGRSGAGKSTLLRLTNRLTDPTEGRITFRDIDVSALRGSSLLDWRSRCAMIFQQFNLVPRLDVLTNVMLGRISKLGTLRTVFSLFSDDDRRLALLALERLGIVDTALQKAGTLSGGQQQRVAIARALVQEPEIILADEPIASLDPLNAKHVMEALRRINEEEGITVICNLHTLDTARTYCNRIIGMSAGRIVFDGTADELTVDAAREIYGAGKEFDEATTSTSLPPTSVAQPGIVDHEQPAAIAV